MLLIQLIVILIVIGVLLYVVETLLPIDPAIKNIIRIIILLAVVLWLLSLVGLIPGGPLRVSLCDPDWGSQPPAHLAKLLTRLGGYHV